MTQTPHPAPAPVALPFAQVHEVRAEVERIEALSMSGLSADRTYARSAARDLAVSVLEAIASGNAQGGYLAAEALKVRDLLA